MKRLLASSIILATSALAQSNDGWVGMYGNETSGAVLPLAVEARIAKWAAISGTPTTLGGYGITDGATAEWVIQYVSENTQPLSMTNEPAFKGWTNIWHDLITNHLNVTAGNPHGITPAMIGAATTDELATAISEYNENASNAVANSYLSLTNCNWSVQRSCSEFAFAYGTTSVLTLSYSADASPLIIAMSVATNPPTLTFTFRSVGTTNRLETAVAPTNGADADWQTWNTCTWSYAGTTGTVVATGIDIDVPTWARIVSLSGIANTNPFILFGAQPYFGSVASENQLVTRGQISALDPALLDAKLSSKKTIVEGAIVIITNSQTGAVETNFSIGPGPVYDGWNFDEETGEVYINNLLGGYIHATNVTVESITVANNSITNEVAVSVTLDGTTYYADSDGDIDLGDIGVADNTTMVTGLSIRVGTDVNNPGTNTMVVGERSGATARNGIALGYRASAIHSNSFVWSDASSESAFNSRTNNSFSIRATGGAYIDAPTFEITGQYIGDGSGLSNVVATSTNAGATQIVANVNGAPPVTGTYDSATSKLTLENIPIPEPSELVFDGLRPSSAASVSGGQVTLWCQSNSIYTLDMTGANTITAAVPWVIQTNGWTSGDIPMFSLRVAMDADATWAWPVGCVTNVAAPAVSSTNFYMFLHNGSAWCAY